MLGWFKKKRKNQQAESFDSENEIENTAPHSDDSHLDELAHPNSVDISETVAVESKEEEQTPVAEEQSEAAPEQEPEPQISSSSSWLVRKSDREEFKDSTTAAESAEEREFDEDSSTESDVPKKELFESGSVEPKKQVEEPLTHEPIEETAKPLPTEPIPAEVSEPPETLEQQTLNDLTPDESTASLAAPLEDSRDVSSEPESLEQPESEKPALKIIKESEVQEKKKKKSLFSRLTDRLGKTRESFTYQMDALFLGKKEIDADLLDDLEEIMITADLGVGTTEELLDYTRRKVKRKELKSPDALKEALKEKIKTFIVESAEDTSLVMPDSGPFVVMMIGVNGVGKTTTIGKIANKFQKVGNSVMLVAGDTFRAAAVSQLQIWGKRNNVPVVAHKEGADPSSVVFDALGIAQSKNIDVVLVDTAGRMHTKDNLMEELKKIKRVMGKKLPGSPHEVMLVLDATTGQNAISQAKLFDEAVQVTGLTLTKLDGTSKGGIVANICREMKIPIRFIGIGEKMDDLRDFDPGEFVDALFQGKNSSHE